MYKKYKIEYNWLYAKSINNESIEVYAKDLVSALGVFLRSQMERHPARYINIIKVEEIKML